MKKELNDLIKYRCNRAREAIEEARIDYEVFVAFNESDVKPWLEEAEYFVNFIITLIEQDLKPRSS